MSTRPVQRKQEAGLRSFPSRSRSLCEILFVFVCLLGIADAAHWGYASEESEGDRDWEGLCRSGSRQSPVDLSRTNALLSNWIEPISFIHYNRPVATNISNNGHTVVLNLDQGQKEVGIAAGGLHGYYILDSVHFHWGGSEHTFKGQRLDMEVHLVHYNAEYDSLSEAKDKPRGLAVIGVVIRETSDDNPLLNPLITRLGESNDTIDTPGESIDLPTLFSPQSLLPNNRSHFFRYSGSLTTPPCSETVEWTVLYRTVNASRRQLDQFKTQKSHSSREVAHIPYNYRRIQPHYDRKILFVQSSHYQSIYEDKSEAIRFSVLPGLVAFLALCVANYGSIFK